MNKIFVTGHKGKIGSILANELKRQGKEVVVFNERLNDYHKLSNFLKLNKDIDVIINTAAKFRGTAVDMIESNVSTVANLAQVVTELEINSHIIHFSTGGVYSPTEDEKTELSHLLPPTIYTLSKKMGEEALQVFLTDNLNKLTILRPGSVYGNGIEDGFIYWFEKKARNGEALVLKGVDTKVRSIVNISYLINVVNYLIHNQVTGVFNISSGKLTLGRAIELLRLKYSNLIVTKLSEDTDNDKLTHMALDASKIHSLLPVKNNEKYIY